MPKPQRGSLGPKGRNVVGGATPRRTAPAADSGPPLVRDPRSGLRLPPSMVPEEPKKGPRDTAPAEGRKLERANELYGRLMTQLREREGGLPRVPQAMPTVGGGPKMRGLAGTMGAEPSGLSPEQRAARAQKVQEQLDLHNTLRNATVRYENERDMPAESMGGQSLYQTTPAAQGAFLRRRNVAQEQLADYERRARLNPAEAGSALPAHPAPLYADPMSHAEVAANVQDKADRERIALERLRAIAGGPNEPPMPSMDKVRYMDAPDAIDRALESPEERGRGAPPKARFPGRGLLPGEGKGRA